MSNLSDEIGEYLKKLLQNNSIIKVQRSDLARKFGCVPSQINYVLNTRFTQERGYIIESQRGGSGYIKIKKLNLDSREEIINDLYKKIGDSINQQRAINIIERLYEKELITSFEVVLFKSLVHRKTLKLSPFLRDKVRARLLKQMLRTLLRKEG